MLIAGFQKNSFVDYPGKVAAVIFAPYCNMRCRYCHNRHILSGDLEFYDEDAILEFLDRRRGLLDAVVISGGEPTLRPNLSPFIDSIRELGYLVKLDTNGTAPLLLADLIRAGKLDYVAMDIKAPFDKYHTITGTADDLGAIRQSMNLLINSGIDHEFRTTFDPSLTPDDIAAIAAELVGTKHYFINQYRPRDDADPRAHSPETVRDATARAAAILGAERVSCRGI